jgi:hypothetical protein
MTPQAAPTTTETVREINLLEAALAETVVRRRPRLKPDASPVLVTETGLAVPSRRPVTQEQKNVIAELRRKCLVLGGDAAAAAGRKCQPFEDAAATYAAELRAFLAPKRPEQIVTPAAVAPKSAARREAGAAVGLPVTAKQWNYIRHLRKQLGKVNEPWAKEMAGREISNNRKTASDYIDGIIRALKRQYEARPSGQAQRAGGRICSVCWTPGCGIGPMINN